MSYILQAPIVLLAFLLPTAGVFAQGTLADYQRAERFLAKNLNDLVFSRQVRPNWLDGKNRFWYVNKIPQGKEFILVDAQNNTKSRAFDHIKLAENLSAVASEQYSPDELPFDRFKFVNEGKSIQFKVKNQRYECNLESYKCKKLEAETEPAESKIPYGARSPDGKWIAFVEDYNLFVLAVEPNETRQLTFDGQKHYDYATPVASPSKMIEQGRMDVRQKAGVQFSPDSKKLLTYRIDQRKAGRFHIVQSSPKNGLRPKHYEYAYPLPGEEDLPKAKRIIFDLETGKRIDVSLDLEPLLYYGSPEGVKWSKDSTRFYFVKMDRGYKRARLMSVDAETGGALALVEEKVETMIDPHMLYWRLVNEGNEIIFSSERDGFCHLYLYDGTTWQEKNQITKGSWVVRGIEHVDEKNRKVYFTAGGRQENRDPYLRHLYSVNFRGTELKLLTPEDAEHDVNFSPSGEYFVDVYSRVDKPPVSVLRRSDTGELIRRLEEAQVGPLLETGIKLPEAFVAKGRDGKTDIYGVVYRPSNLDESKKYPVIEHIYSGPHGFYTPKAFRAYRNSAQPIAELGFIVVIVDGMGTAKRSRAFHEVSYKNLGDGGFADRIAWMKALAEKYPYVDISRVGVYGHSAGGYDAAHALLTHPEFYKVGVSSAGNHDHRMDKAWWVELWMGYPVEEHYIEQSNVTLAKNLEGKLLLVHGEVDDNVNPAATLQLVDALIKADKYFDMLIMPNRSHGLGGDYFTLKRWNYFVEHLLGVEPPADFRIGKEEKEEKASE
jgi:dipeptidyl-peptidase-4